MINVDNEILASAARTATTNTETLLNNKTRGGVFTISVTAAGATGTVTPSIEGKIGDNYYTILTATAISATGVNVLRAYPGLVAVANKTVNDLIPEKFRVKMTHSATTSWTYSINTNMVE